MIILINGSIASGKSTVARLLAENIPNTAIVEVDMLRDMIAWMPTDDAVPINLENAVSVIRNFVARRMNVVVPYPLSKQNYEYLDDHLRDLGVEMKVFTFAPVIEGLLTGKHGRMLNSAEKERVKYHYSIGIHNPDFGEVIDNSEQSEQQTVEDILHRIGSSRK